MRDFLFLARGLARARTVPGPARPNLEDLAPDLPYVPPVGPPIPTVLIDGGAILAEVDEDDVGDPFEL